MAGIQQRPLMERPLTPKQASFASEYLIDFNGKQSAVRAGYSPKAAEVTASKLVKDPRIKLIIDTELHRRQNENRIDAERVIEGLHELAFKKQNITDANKLRALELLGRHFNVFKEKQEETKTEIKITLPPGMQMPTTETTTTTTTAKPLLESQ